MDYIKEMNAFYDCDMANQLTPNAISLYFALLNIANRLFWKADFVVSNLTLQSKSGIKDRKTLARTRNQLIQKELIIYKPSGRVNQAGTYTVLGCVRLIQRNNATQDGTQDKPVGHPVGKNATQSVPQDVPQSVPQDVPINKQNINKTKQKQINIYADFVKWYNSQFQTKHRVDTYRDKLKTRLKTFSIDQLKTAAVNMHNDPYMTGKNENGRIYATLEYLLRNDKNVDKWLVQKPKSRSQPQEPVGDKFEDIYLT